MQTMRVEQVANTAVAATLPGLVVDYTTAIPRDHLIDGTLAAAGIRRMLPWDKVYDVTSQFPRTDTGVWMDALGRDQWYHRWKGHHVIKDGWTTLVDPDLSLMEFTYELPLDAVTFHGLPLLPDTAVSVLSDALGVSVHKIMPWVLMNPVDLTIGVLALSDAMSDLFIAFSGQAEWGLQTAIFTFGTGSVEIAGGMAMQNPFLVASGVGEGVAGAVSAWSYYNQPFLFGVPVADILTGLGIGAGVGVVTSMVAMGLNWRSTSVTRKLENTSKATAIAATLGAMAAISPWLSIPAGLSWTAGNLAFQLARRDGETMKHHRLASSWSLRRDYAEVVELCGAKKAFQLLNELHFSDRLEDYERFIGQSLDGSFDDFIAKAGSNLQMPVISDSTRTFFK